MSPRPRKLKIDPLWGQIIPSGLLKGDVRKAEIVEAVVRLVASHGIDGISFEILANATGMTKSQVKYHLESKEEMLFRSYQYVLHHAQTIVVQEMSSSQPGLSRLTTYVRGNFSWLMQKPDQLRFMLQIYGAATHSAGLRKLVMASRKAAQQRIEGMIREALPGADIAVIGWSQTFHDMITGALVDLVCSYGVPPKAVVESRLELLLKHLETLWKLISKL